MARRRSCRDGCERQRRTSRDTDRADNRDDEREEPPQRPLRLCLIGGGREHRCWVFQQRGPLQRQFKYSNEKKNGEARGKTCCDVSGTTRNEVKGRQPNEQREAGVASQPDRECRNQSLQPPKIEQTHLELPKLAPIAALSVRRLRHFEIAATNQSWHTATQLFDGRENLVYSTVADSVRRSAVNASMVGGHMRASVWTWHCSRFGG
jgi:hypothetical protein